MAGAPLNVVASRDGQRATSGAKCNLYNKAPNPLVRWGLFVVVVRRQWARGQLVGPTIEFGAKECKAKASERKVERDQIRANKEGQVVVVVVVVGSKLKWISFKGISSEPEAGQANLVPNSSLVSAF